MNYRETHFDTPTQKIIKKIVFVADDERQKVSNFNRRIKEFSRKKHAIDTPRVNNDLFNEEKTNDFGVRLQAFCIRI